MKQDILIYIQDIYKRIKRYIGENGVSEFWIHALVKVTALWSSRGLMVRESDL